eukprot:1440974-Pyramimonas_sp.AAC.2
MGAPGPLPLIPLAVNLEPLASVLTPLPCTDVTPGVHGGPAGGRRGRGGGAAAGRQCHADRPAGG